MEVKYHREIARGGIIALIGMFIGRVIAYLFNLVVARLGTTEFGALNLGIEIVNLVALLSLLGLRIGVVRYVSYYNEKKDYPRVKGAIDSSLMIALPISIFFSFILFIFSENISLQIFHSSELIFILKMFSFIIPFVVFTAIIVGAIRGFKRIGYNIFLKEFFQISLTLILALLLIYMGYGLKGSAFSFFLSAIVTAFVAFYILRKKVMFFIDSKIKAIQYKKELFLFSVPLIFIGFLPMFIKWASDFILGAFRGVSEVGIYSSATITSNLMLIIPLSLTSLFMPVLMGLYSSNKKEEVKQISKITSKWILLINFPVFILMALFSREILLIFFGQNYISGGTSLAILALSYVFFSLGYVHMEILSSIDKTKTVFYITLITIISHILLNYILIPKFGMIGAAIATLISFFLLYLLSYLMNFKLTKIQTLQFGFLKIITAGLISWTVVYYLRTFFMFNPIIQLLLLVITFLFIYFILLIILKLFGDEDRDIFNSVLKRIKSILKI